MSENRNKPYKSKAWKDVRAAVLKRDKGLCQRCLGNYMPDAGAPKRHTRAVLVHHHFHVDEYPELKYRMYVVMPDGKRVRNLYSLCSECHEFVHADTHRNAKQKLLKYLRNENFTTEERWD